MVVVEMRYKEMKRYPLIILLWIRPAVKYLIKRLHDLGFVGVDEYQLTIFCDMKGRIGLVHIKGVNFPASIVKRFSTNHQLSSSRFLFVHPLH